jgi:CO dehydrogenase maturation factor
MVIRAKGVSMEHLKPRIVAVCGKGGVGKTSLSALIVRQLMREGGTILAVDADPAVGFATALGIDPGRTINDIRNDVIREAKQGDLLDRESTVLSLDYSVFEAMSECTGYAFLAIGRPETEGCYCRVNDYLRAVIEALSAKFDYVVIDGEAGIEQINRRVMESVTHLLLVSDASRKGINVIQTIKRVADGGAMGYDRAGVILNRLRDAEEAQRVDIGELELLAPVVEDDAVRDYDIDERSLLGLPDDETTRSLCRALVRFGIIEGA